MIGTAATKQRSLDKDERVIEELHEAWQRVHTDFEEVSAELAEKYESEWWKQTVEQVLKPEHDRVAHAECGISLTAGDGKFNIVKLAIARGQYNEVGLLLRRAEELRSRKDGLNKKRAELSAQMEEVQARIQKKLGGDK